MLAHAFDPSFLRRLDNLTLGIRRARTVRLGRRALGRVRGPGIEVENFKDYSEGDDLRFLDWNALARLDSLTIKSYRVERETEVNILLDASASMALPAADQKFELARAVAAALVYVAIGQNDPVRIVSFRSHRGRPAFNATDFMRRVESYAGLQPTLAALRAEGAIGLEEACTQLLGERRSPGVTIIISDFLFEPARYQGAMMRLLDARYEVKAIQVLGEREASFRLTPGAYRLRDSETGEMRELTLSPAAIEACRRRLAHLREELANYCSTHGIVYGAVIGTRNFEDFLVRELPRLGLVE